MTTVEPDKEPSDPHLPDLDDEDDYLNLSPDDPRRIEVERKRGVTPGVDSQS